MYKNVFMDKKSNDMNDDSVTQTFAFCCTLYVWNIITQCFVTGTQGTIFVLNYFIYKYTHSSHAY